MSLIQNRDIIIVGQQPWDIEIGSNCKNIAMEFSKHNRVLYVNSPLDRITSLRDRQDAKTQKRLAVIRGDEKGLKSVSSNLWVLYPERMIESINWLPSSPLYNYLNRVNNQRFANCISKGIKTLGFSNFIIFNDNDIFRSLHLKELLQPDVSIYYSRDNVKTVDYWKRHGMELEPEIIAKSDICLSNSRYLAANCKKYNENTFIVGQGCELDPDLDTSKLEKPADLASLKKPIIGYIGALIELRLDIKILQHISEQRKDWHIVLVGPEDEAFKNSILHKLPNVHFLGHKDPSLLATYINFFDVCINPQRINEMTIGNYPRKIDEYLALGKPVVATKTEGMEIFTEHTYLGDTKEDYVKLIDLALREDSPKLQQKRKDFAATHSWENSVAEMYKAILSFYKTRELSKMAAG